MSEITFHGEPFVLHGLENGSQVFLSQGLITDHFAEIMLGLRPHAITAHVAGYNPTIGMNWEMLDPQGTLVPDFVWLESEQTLTIVSDSADDHITGSGARLVRVLVLDDDFEPEWTVVSLSGLTPVELLIPGRRVVTAQVIEVGTYHGSNVGNLLISAGTDYQICIPAGFGQSMCFRTTVPAGYVALVLTMGLTVEEGKGLNLRIRGARQILSSTVSRVGWSLDAVIGTVIVPLPLPFRLEPGTDFWIEGQSTVGAVSSSVAVRSAILFLPDVIAGDNPNWNF